MKVYETRIVTREEAFVVGKTCDWCGCDLPAKQEKFQRYPETFINFIVIKFLIEEAYGDGWTIEDLCETCGFKIADILEANGIPVKRYDF